MNENANAAIKVALSTILFAVWAWFVYTGKAPVEPFLQTCREGLVALGVFHATQALPPRS